MKEIVGAIINGKIITNNPKHIIAALEMKLLTRWLFRGELEFMAVLDLGPQWDRLAKGQTLFLMDKQGKPHEYIPGEAIKS